MEPGSYLYANVKANTLRDKNRSSIAVPRVAFEAGFTVDALGRGESASR